MSKLFTHMEIWVTNFTPKIRKPQLTLSFYSAMKWVVFFYLWPKSEAPVLLLDQERFYTDLTYLWHFATLFRGLVCSASALLVLTFLLELFLLPPSQNHFYPTWLRPPLFSFSSFYLSLLLRTFKHPHKKFLLIFFIWTLSTFWRCLNTSVFGQYITSKWLTTTKQS